jgi:ParB family chromosome partitioning protein
LARHAVALFDEDGKLAFDMETLRVAVRSLLIDVCRAGRTVGQRHRRPRRRRCDRRRRLPAEHGHGGVPLVPVASGAGGLVRRHAGSAPPEGQGHPRRPGRALQGRSLRPSVGAVTPEGEDELDGDAVVEPAHDYVDEDQAAADQDLTDEQREAYKVAAE